MEDQRPLEGTLSQALCYWEGGPCFKQLLLALKAPNIHLGGVFVCLFAGGGGGEGAISLGSPVSFPGPRLPTNRAPSDPSDPNDPIRAGSE